mmetsp:Transcript_10495/g.32605  ORF Transcript_10495/g.32605 Transcript_10495/m.32605 type:complete len:232 (-) Transcript_10495:801-1496(-)
MGNESSVAPRGDSAFCGDATRSCGLRDTSSMTASRVLTMNSMSSRPMHRGGLIRITLLCWPPLPTSRPYERQRSMTSAVSSAAGSRVRRSRTSSMPTKRPTPRTSPMIWCLRLSSSSLGMRRRLISRALRCRPSASMMSSTAVPAAHATGFPPLVLKYCTPSKASAISRRHTTAPSGKPLPMGLPSTRMSGTTPCASKAQKCVPQRPKPVCTSSAMTMPPAWRMWAYALRR